MILVYILLFFFIFILLSAVGIIGTIARILFGGTRRAANTTGQNRQESGRNSNKWYTYQKKREKIFDKTDGEYVEFEEVKEDKE